MFLYSWNSKEQHRQILKASQHQGFTKFHVLLESTKFKGVMARYSLQPNATVVFIASIVLLYMQIGQ